MEKLTKVRTYSKSELADAYNIDIETLRTWLRRSGLIEKMIEKCFYKPSQKVFTPKQVAMIFETIGEP